MQRGFFCSNKIDNIGWTTDSSAEWPSHLGQQSWLWLWSSPTVLTAPARLLLHLCQTCTVGARSLWYNGEVNMFMARCASQLGWRSKAIMHPVWQDRQRWTLEERWNQWDLQSLLWRTDVQEKREQNPGRALYLYSISIVATDVFHSRFKRQNG